MSNNRPQISEEKEDLDLINLMTEGVQTTNLYKVDCHQY